MPGATGYLDTDYAAKAEKGLELLDRHDIVYVHVEAPDEASHAGSLHEKIKAIEQIDEKVVGYLLERIGSDVRLLIATDHATPLSHEDPLRVPRAVRGLSKRAKAGSGRRLR